MAKVGYARVSSSTQNLDIQLSRLSDCDKIFAEKMTGIDGNRPKLKECLDYVREGDTLVVTRLDRLARSTLHLCQILDGLQKKGIIFVVLDQNIDTGTSYGKLLVNMLAAIGEFERDVIKERQREGIKRALEKGVKFGRQSTVSPEDIRELRSKREEGKTIRELMRDYRLSKASIYRLLATVG